VYKRQTKQRYISTSIWDDDWFWAQEDSAQKFYFYILTNSMTNVAGVYQITLSRIAKDTRWKVVDVERVLAKFEREKKAFYRGGYIILPSAPHHQKWWLRPTIKKGIVAILKSLPDSVLHDLTTDEIGYRYPIDTLPVSYTEDTGIPTSDLDLDLDSDLGKEKKEKKEKKARRFDENDFELMESTPSEAPPPATLSPMKDPVSQRYQEVFTTWTPAEAWKSIPQERKHLSKLGSMTTKLAGVIAVEPLQLVDIILDHYRRMKRTVKQEYWKNAPLLPSALVSRWDALVAAIDGNLKSEQKAKVMSELYRKHRESQGVTKEEIDKEDQDYREFVESCDEAMREQG